MLTEFVRERLAQLLAENTPRRARPVETPTRPEARSSTAGAGRRRVTPAAAAGEPCAAVGARIDHRSPPDLVPSDDGEESGSPGSAQWGTDSTTFGPRRASSGPAGPVPRDDVVQDEIDDWADVAPHRSFGRAHLGVVIGLLLVGLVCAGWAVLRARPVAIASPPIVRSTATQATTGPSSGVAPRSAAPTAAPIMVHVLGAVKKPGVVTLPERSRVSDAIEAAGGLQRGAEPGELNLAQVLTDGQQIVIGTKKQPSGEVRDGSGGTQPSGGHESASGTGAEVNLNTATQSQLEELPGVGPVTAGKIVAWREEHGRFSRVEELQEIDGIGPKTFAQIAPHTRV